MKVLIVFAYQWGYNTDYLFFSKLLREEYEVTYIGYDLNLPRVEAGDVNIINVQYNGKFSIIRLLKAVAKEVQTGGYSHLLINYFLLCSLLHLILPRRLKKIVDIRTSFIYPNKLKTKMFNGFMRWECKFFRYITTVSMALQKFLKLPDRTHILPLGGPSFELKQKTFDEMNLLYVGTFYDRDIVQTIKAFSRFKATHADKINMKYTIIGFGTPEEIADVESHIISLSLQEDVRYLGPIRYPALNEYFLTHNIGVCYIPLTSYYDCQPPTKTFEYLLSGNVVLGTNTAENRKVITFQNGVLVGDSVNEFYNGMVYIYNNRACYNSLAIQGNAVNYSWSSIVSNNLIPYLIQINR